jgi:hypothetical protein
MASSISKTKTLNEQDRAILRSIYFRQKLPLELLKFNSALLAQRIKLMEMSGLIGRDGDNYRLTDVGVIALRKFYGGKKPPMIDFKRGARLDHKARKRQFVVGSSLASEIAREVRFSD